MILEFSVANYKSIMSEETMDFRINKSECINESSVKIQENLYVNNISGVIGANASGKTNILRALYDFTNFAEKSYESPKENSINYLFHPHFAFKEKDTIFTVTFINNNEKYFYKLVIGTIDKKRGIKEEILKKGRKHIFKRELEHKLSGLVFSEKLINENDLKRLEDHITFLSLLKGLNYFKLLHPEILKNVFGIVDSYSFDNFHDIPLNFKMMELIPGILTNNPEYLTNLNNAISKVDFGIESFDLDDAQRIDENNNLQEVKILFAKHKLSKEEFLLPILAESEGTKNFIPLYINLLMILKSGGTLVIDEIENSLHMDLVYFCLKLFMNKKTNYRNARLLFSTHNPELLKGFHKSQIYIIEKNEKLETEVYRLSDYTGIRNDDNLIEKYKLGAYGGKPRIMRS